MSDPRYPIGRFRAVQASTATELTPYLQQIADLPAQLRAAVAGMTDRELATPYRDGGWTIRQVVHHLADSHMNAYVRVKWALTEERPQIKTYFEDRWAELPDGVGAPADLSLALIEALHERWLLVLRSLDDAGFDRPLLHPEWGQVTVGWLVQLYAWHGRHHLAHIGSARARAQSALAG